MRTLTLIGLLLLASSSSAQPVVVVSPSGPVRTLADGLRRVSRGGRVVVKAGVYAGPTVVVARPVSIEGEPGAVLDGAHERPILVVRADSVSVRGLVFRNVPTSFVDERAAVRMDSVRHCTVEGNRFEDTFFGIYLARTSHCRIAGNVLVGRNEKETTSGNGIHLWNSDHVVIDGNTVDGHRDGIYLEFARESQVRGNTSRGNKRYGLHFMFSDRCRYERNTFRQNAAGVAVMYTKHVAMVGNRFEDNWGSAAYGLLLKDITDSEVVGNRFVRNTVGLYAEGVNRVRVAGNVLVANGWAVKVMADAEGNTFTRNHFAANTFDVATNSRRSNSTFRENYWDQYRGYDLDRDGFGDVPFRPVRLFSLLVEQNEPSLMLLRSFFVQLLDAAERVFPVLTPGTLVDERPLMKPLAPAGGLAAVAAVSPTYASP